jgi:hypothetical protein
MLQSRILSVHSEHPRPPSDPGRDLILNVDRCGLETGLASYFPSQNGALSARQASKLAFGAVQEHLLLILFQSRRTMDHDAT